MPSGRRTLEDKDKMVARARDLRRQGLTHDEIAAELKISVTTVRRWVQGVRKPPKPRNPGKKLAATKKQELRGDRERNRIDTPGEDDETRPRVLVMPRNPDGYLPVRDDDGVMVVNPHLIGHASDVLDTWLDDKVNGNLLTVTPVERAKAVIVTATALRLDDYDIFLTHRDRWGAMRELAGLTTEDIANEVGIAYVTVSRYERAKRNPDGALVRKLHEAYVNAQATAIDKATWVIASHDYADAELGGDYEAVTDHDDLMWWIAGDSDEESFTIEHLKGLAQIRGMLPYPTWTEPSAANLFLKGYNKATVPA